MLQIIKHSESTTTTSATYDSEYVLSKTWFRPQLWKCTELLLHNQMRETTAINVSIDVLRLCVSERTLLLRHQVAWRTCSGGSQTVWTWPARWRVSKCSFLMRLIDSLIWVSRPGMKRAQFAVWHCSTRCVCNRIYVSALVYSVWTPSWATCLSRDVQACFQPLRHRSWRSWWGLDSGTQSESL